MSVKKFNRPDRPPLELVDNGSCPHRHYGAFVDRDAREVTCRKCEQRLDAFDVLVWMTEDFRLQKWKAQRLEEAEQKAQERAEQARGRAWAKANGWMWNRPRQAWYRRGMWVWRTGCFVIAADTDRRQWVVADDADITRRDKSGPLFALGVKVSAGPFATMVEAMKEASR